MSGAQPTVAIVGGGFSGAAVAHHLACAEVSADIGLPQVSAYAQFVASQVETAFAALRPPEPAPSRGRPAVLVQS
jgi:hypothetical protein